jgi:epsilon-lactone hydrolase
MKKRRHTSLTGSIARESIRILISTSKLKNGGLFTESSKYAKSPSRWKIPKGYSLDKFNIDGIPMELLRVDADYNDHIILQLHGGSYLMGFADIYRRLALRYVKISRGASVLSVDYRIAPEYKYPAALDDAFAAWNWLLSHNYQAKNILVTGDSAGGNLALALVIKLRESGGEMPRGLILMSPWADMTGSGESRAFNYERDPMFGKSAGDERADHIREAGNPYAGDSDLKDPHLSPIYAEFDQFPPMLIQAGDWEILLSDSRTIVKKAREAGVDVTLTEYPGMFHVFQMFCGLLPESRCAWREVENFVQKCFAE